MSTAEVESIEVDRDAYMTIVFADGVTVRYDVGELRLACPCATCVGRRNAGQSVAPPVERGEAISITDAQLSGAFGINLDWSDGHRTGIYAWTYLRDAFDAGRLGQQI